MKKALIIIAITTCSPFAQALDGHNGILFSMTQQQLETKGFMCNPETEREGAIIATCRHMDMTGVAFSVPTQNYEVGIGPNNRVASIRADLVGIRTLADYFALHTRVGEFFPNKDENNTKSAQGVFRNEFWRDKNNAGISIISSPGIRGFKKDTLWVTFYSPFYMAASDKPRTTREAEAAEKEARTQKGE